VPWSPGDLLTHRFNPELGVGRVTAVEGRAIVVEFPRAKTTLRIAATSDALTRVEPGSGIRDQGSGVRDPGPEESRGSEHVFAPDDVVVGDVKHLRRVRGSGVASFLGGRVRLFPHQLYVAARATQQDPVRWLLADEVGLGKTIEACLILNRLVHTRKVERCLVVVPNALTVQWLGELWRKYHQVFTLLDNARLADVARDFGAGFNPFDVHRRVVIALEMLIEHPELTVQAVRAGIDLLVVDEAQRIRRPPGHPGDRGWRAIAPIAALGRHVLLLTATPLEDDAHGFFRLLQLLRPEEFPEDVSFDDRLASGTPLPPCTSSTRRSDIGGLPPRVGIPVDLPDGGPTESAPFDAASASLDWLLTQAPKWREAKEKTLVFVARREALEMLRTALSHRAQLATGAFHEDLSPAQRDMQVARFREPDGPSLLVSTEAGGEGRNFEFCRRLVLFDLPWKPTVVEQRIGRLDRIGRRIPVEIVYFRPPHGIDADAVRLFEALGVFREPLAGLEPQLAHIEAALEEIARNPDASLTDEWLNELVADARAARTRIREAAYQQLHRDPYRSDMAAAILARVPTDLDALTERIVTTACARLGFRVEHLRGRATFAVEFGSEAIVDSLPGVPGGSSFVGSFDREEAVEDESIDFFASGHPLVEGVLAYFEDQRLA
jgi:ATP-dependent helicase HepA